MSCGFTLLDISTEQVYNKYTSQHALFTPILESKLSIQVLCSGLIKGTFFSKLRGNVRTTGCVPEICGF